MEGVDLHPILEGTTHLFRLSDVKALAARRAAMADGSGDRLTGAQAAEAFALFDEGKGMREVVRALGMLPSTVRYLHDEWSTPLGEMLPAERREAERAAREEAEREEARIDREYALRRSEDGTYRPEVDAAAIPAPAIAPPLEVPKRRAKRPKVEVHEPEPSEAARAADAMLAASVAELKESEANDERVRAVLSALKAAKAGGRDGEAH